MVFHLKIWTFSIKGIEKTCKNLSKYDVKITVLSCAINVKGISNNDQLLPPLMPCTSTSQRVR